jgi:2-haloalkanoic acid dehalogenase type II
MTSGNHSVRAVLFDFGGTLYDYDTLLPGDRQSLHHLAELAGAQTDSETVHRAYRTALRAVFRDYVRRDYYLHRDMFREAVDGMLRALGLEATEEQVERYREMQWRLHEQNFQVREGVPETLAELRRRGLALGIVSNIDKDQLDHLGRLAELERYFDWIMSSEEAGSCKPDARIFEEALRRAGCAADEALFVGDSIQHDIAGANRVGIRSVLLWHKPDRKPPDEHGIRPHHVISKIPELLNIVE